MEASKAKLIDHVLELEQKVFRALRPIVPQEWVHTELTMPQFRALFVLLADGPTRMSILASTLNIALATATGIIDRLVKQGLIVREGQPEDRRVVVCRLSEKGHELMSRLWESGQARARNLLETMSTAQLQLVAGAMEAILQAALKVEQDLRLSPGSELPELRG